MTTHSAKDNIKNELTFTPAYNYYKTIIKSLKTHKEPSC